MEAVVGVRVQNSFVDEDPPTASDVCLMVVQMILNLGLEDCFLVETLEMT